MPERKCAGGTRIAHLGGHDHHPTFCALARGARCPRDDLRRLLSARSAEARNHHSLIYSQSPAAIVDGSLLPCAP